MTQSIDRRDFFKLTGAVSAAMILADRAGLGLCAADKPRGAPHAEKLGWRLGCQAYSFNRFTFFEAIDKVASLGLHYIEAYPGQKLSQQKPEVKFGEDLPAEIRQEVNSKLAQAGVKLVCYGVVGLPKDQQACRRVFEFAKQMGIETIVSEPPADAFELIDALATEYQINVAIHNHPRPSHYWNPDTVLEVCKGRSQRIGACADTGHWMRSGINPVDALRKLKGRIISFHFKDLNQYGPLAHDVPWGTGKGDIRAVLKEVYAQRFQGVFSVEYEHNWLNSLPEIAQCVEFFDRVAAELTT